MKYERAAALLEGEHGREDAVAVAARVEAVLDGVDADDEVLDVLVGQDDPAVAVGVLGRADGRAGLLARRAQDLLDLADDAREVARGIGLEDDPRLARGRDLVRRLERDVRGGQREQAVLLGRLGGAAAAEQRVEEPHGAGGYAVPCSCASRRDSAAMRFSIGGCVANIAKIDCFDGGEM
jgi:hypothetical protein